MTPERWRQIARLFEHATTLEPQERRRWVTEACGNDSDVRREVEALLDADGPAGAWLDRVQLAIGEDVGSLEPGARLGPYEIVRRIGTGGMGEVYAARDTRLGRVVAIKVLPDIVASDPEWRNRFEREARAVSSLAHPNICTLHDIGEHDGLPYLVMELLQGETLAARIERGALPIAETINISRHIAAALDCAHRQGIIHRDVKPSNVMLTTHGAKLLDFGVARGQVEVSNVSVGGVAAFDGSTMLTGTPAYMAPEQFRGTAADVRSDLFAFGAVVFEMLAGRRAFPGDNAGTVMAAVAGDEVPSILDARSDVPVVLDRLVSSCLAKDPAVRCPSASRVLQELERIAGDERAHASGKSSRSLLRMVIAAVSIVVTGLLVWRASVDGASIRTVTLRPTTNVDAWSAYVLGIDFVTRSDEERHLRSAVRSFEDATKRDPRFAAAFAELSMAHSLIWWQRFDREPERKEQARRALDSALALDPSSADSRKALAYYYYHCELDLDSALREFALAAQKKPNDPEIIYGYANVLRRQGRVSESLRLYLEVVKLRPRSAVYWQNLALTYALLRRGRETDEALEHATSMNPEFPMAYGARAHWLLRLDGDVQRARAVLSSTESLGLSDDGEVTYQAVQVDVYERNFHSALKRLRRHPKDVFEYQTYYTPKALLEAQVLVHLDRHDAARAAYTQAISLLETQARAFPDDSRVHSSLGVAYAGLGRRTDALREGRRAVTLTPVHRDILRGAYRAADLARIHAMVGERDAAVTQLEHLMSIPFDLAPPGLRLDPAWDSLRDHPGFRRLLGR